MRWVFARFGSSRRLSKRGSGLSPVCALILLVVLATAPLSARASVIISETGPDSTPWLVGVNLASPIGGQEAIAASWTSTENFTDVDIAARLFSYGSFPGTAYLTTSIGPTATATNLVAEAPFVANAYPPSSTWVTLFTDLKLKPATYFLVVASPQRGTAGWTSGAPLNIVTATGVTDNSSYFASDDEHAPVNVVYPPASNFVNEYLDVQYVVTSSVPAAVSEPAVFPLFATGLSLMALLAWRTLKRRRAMMRLRQLLAAVAALMFAANASPAHALAIIADATGFDAGFVDDFWGAQFISGSGSIQSVTFNITATGDYFDFDGSEFLNFTHPQPGYGPVLGAMNGLTPLDITVTTPQQPGYCGSCLGHPLTLTFAFAADSFIAGDWFRFSADVDTDTTPGGFFGLRGASFDVLMEDGRSFGSPFVRNEWDHSVSVIEASEPDPKPTPTPVPEPATFPLFAIGLGLMVWFRWRRQARRQI